MPRVSKNSKGLVDVHRFTMEQCASFDEWSNRYLRNKTREADYRKAFDLVKQPEAEESEAD